MAFRASPIVWFDGDVLFSIKKRRETDFSLWKKGKWLVYSTRNGSSSLCAFKERREAQQFNDVSVPRERKNALERKTFAEPSAKREKLTTFLRLSVLPFYLPPFFFSFPDGFTKTKLWNIFKMAFHTRRARAMWFPLATRTSWLTGAKTCLLFQIIIVRPPIYRSEGKE